MSLQEALLSAHAKDDRAALIPLYQDAAAQSENPDEQAFFLTQAYVFATELGDPARQPLAERLEQLGRL